MSFFRKQVDPREQAANPRAPELGFFSPFQRTSGIEEIHDFFRGYIADEDPYLKAAETPPGICFVCQKEVLFEVDRPADGSPVNWRETMKCPHCGMINRWRACIHLFHEFHRPEKDSAVYLTEALSPIAQHLSVHFPNIVTSEYFEGAQPGKSVFRNGRRIRNEDVTQLSFPTGSLDCILSFDVLEHVPEYKKALDQFSRVLKPGGKLILTVPFSFRQETVVRAIVGDDGTITHLEEPCYHGDPLSAEGVLAFYDFGSSLTDEFRQAGFTDAYISCYRSNLWGYPGANVAFIAQK